MSRQEQKLVSLSGDSGTTPENKETLKYFRYNPTTNRLEADRAVETTLNSLYLGGQHKMSSGGENIFFTNFNSEINYFPIWGGIKDQSVIANRDATGVIQPSGRVYDENVTEVETAGPAAAPGNNVLYQASATVFSDQSVYGGCFIAGEVILATDVLFYEVFEGTDSTGRKLYEQTLTGVALGVDQAYDWFYDHPLEGKSGQVIYFRVTKSDSEDGVKTLLSVRESAAVPGVNYAKAYFRNFIDKDLAFKSDIDALVAGSTYKGAYNDTTSLPSLPTGSDSLGDFYRVNVAGSNYAIGDILIFNGTDYDHIPESSITQTDLVASSIKVYDVYVKAGYSGAVKDGSILYPYSDISVAVDAANDGDTIYLDGIFNISAEIVLPSDKSLTFVGADNTTIQYVSYDASNGDVMSFDGDGTKN